MPQADTRGYDTGKKIGGRKRHIAVDTDGRLLMVNLTTADISDSAGGQMVLEAIGKRWPWVKRLFADGAYDRKGMMDKAAFPDFVVEISKLQEFCGIHGPSPFHDLAAAAPDQPHIRSPLATAAPTSRLRRAGLRKTKPF